MSEWISVKDRLPEKGEEVLVFDTRENWTGFAWLRPDETWAALGFDFPFDLGEVTHWMEIPQPPKGELTALKEFDIHDLKLRECPFCGGTSFVKKSRIDGTDRLFVSVVCRVCFAQTGCYTKEEYAIEAWNRRAREEDKHENLD